MNNPGCVLTIEDPAQTFCECGEPIELWNVPPGHVALPIKWVKNGCGKDHYRKVLERVRRQRSKGNEKIKNNTNT